MADPPDSGSDAASTEERVEHLPRWLIAIAVSLGIGYAGFVALLWRLGLFDVPAGGPDARVFAAVFALLGALFGAVLTFAAALLKHTVDTRTLALNRQTERRLSFENRQTEARLTLETSIRAIELLTNQDGSVAVPTRQAGALFALTHLNQTELALTLLSESWPKGDISATAAVTIIEAGLKTADPIVQSQAAQLYLHNITRVVRPDGMTIPDSLQLGSWPIELSYFARRDLALAQISALASRPRSDFDEGFLNYFTAKFADIVKRDPNAEIRSAAAIALETLLNGYDEGYFLYLESGTLELGPLKQEVRQLLESVEDISSTFEVQLRELYATWRFQAPEGFEYLAEGRPNGPESPTDS